MSPRSDGTPLGRSSSRVSWSPVDPFVEIDVPDDAHPRVSRAARLPDFISLEVDAHRVLDEMKVGVVGAGSVGREMAIALSRLQIGEIRVVDRGRYKPQSLLTQAILPGDVGHWKATSTGEACKTISPRTRVLVFDGPVESLPADAFDELGAVLLATDNLAAEVHVGEQCRHQRIPLFQGSVHGDTLTLQVRSLGNDDPSGPCLACGYGDAEWNRVAQETRFSCEGEAD